MHARNNPSAQQLRRRLRRAPTSDCDPRFDNNSYWALRRQGYSHSQANRAFRDQTPVTIKRTIILPEGVNPDDILFPVGNEVTTQYVELRPTLSPETIWQVKPRLHEYVIWHSTTIGFGLRVRKSGHRSYIFQYRDPISGKQRKITLGSIDMLPFDEARERATEIRFGLSKLMTN